MSSTLIGIASLFVRHASPLFKIENPDTSIHQFHHVDFHVSEGEKYRSHGDDDCVQLGPASPIK